MADIRYLPNAPITEALIDIRVKLPDNFEVQIFDSINEKELKEYPIKETHNEFSADLKVNKDRPSIRTMPKGVRGFFYKSEDGKNIVQFRRDGFTYNRLKPYTKWEDIIGKAKRVWEIYLKYSEPITITRIATRYINQIKLPLPINDFSTYMAAPPQNPYNDDIISSYLNRIKLLDKKDDIGTNIIQTLEKRTDKDSITLLLDIDSYCNRRYKPDDPEIWDQFEKLRSKKNDVFFNSLTEQTIKLHL